MKIKLILTSTLLTFFVSASVLHVFSLNKKLYSSQQSILSLQNQVFSQSGQLINYEQKITDLETDDQRLKNKELTDTAKQIQATFKSSLSTYEDLLDLKLVSKNTTKLDISFGQILNYLSAANYSSASASLQKFQKDIDAEKQKTNIVIIPAAPASNTPPNSGYSRQTVHTDTGDFVVSLVSGNLSSTKIIVDTASTQDCSNNCPVLSLVAYIQRSGAYAGINGSYFCPATYPTCAGKTNSFDLLIMNKNKYYFNSDNNVYSNNPGVIFGGSYIRFVSAVSQWGRDTGIDGMLSNYPLTIFNSNINFGGNSDPKMGTKGNRSFVANRGNTVYIGVVFNVTVGESAHVLKALGMENALNLDSGGSTALYSGGYKVGPGRDIPNAILFVQK